jgi:predicted permease
MLGRSVAESRMEEEFRFHLEMEAAKNLEQGADPEEAKRRAVVSFGGVERYREEMREGRGARALEELTRDVRYALRALRSTPVFTLVVLFTLAAGIGANTAVFSLVDALLLRPLPVPDARELLIVGDATRTNSASLGSPRTDQLSYPLFQDIRQSNRALSDVFASGRTGRIDVRAAGDGAAEAEHPTARYVTGNYFSVLRVPAALGRVFGAEEDRAGGSPVVVISHRYWIVKFAGDHGVIGRSISVNNVPLTVIGVAPPRFDGEIVGQRTEIWIPLTLQPILTPHRPWLEGRDINWLLAMGRLVPGVSERQAAAEITALVHRVFDEQASAGRSRQPEPVPISSGVRGMSRMRSLYSESLTTLMIAVFLVLLIMCANVASLMIMRASARAREMSVRLALGARRLRLVRQLLTESLLLSLAGGVGGLLVADWGSRALLRAGSSGPDPIPLDARLDPRVLAFSALLAILVAVTFGLLPALRATRTDVALTLRVHSRSVASSPLGSGRGWGIGKMLVAGQVALSIVLLLGTGLMLRTMSRLDNIDAGLARDRILIVAVDAGPTGLADDELLQVYYDLLERVKQQPGVTAATFSENGIFSGTESTTTLKAEGFVASAENDTSANFDLVGPNYVRAIGALLLHGRDIDARDRQHSPKVALVNTTMAQFYFGKQSPIGRYLELDSVRYEIVGVVADVIDHDLRATPARRFYIPMAQYPNPTQRVNFEIMTALEPAQLATPIHHAIRAANGSVDVISQLPLQELMRRSIGADRLLARIITLFATVALILSAFGLYGLMSCLTLRRRNEFGLRCALGARPSELTRMVLQESLTLITAGAVAGVPLAFAGMQLIRNRLFGVSPVDPAATVGTLVILAAAVLLAAYIPAARAARVSPLVALRSD